MKQIVIVHANCQGEMLVDILRSHPPFAQSCDCLLFTNYTREPVPEELLRRSDAFLYQHLGPMWGGLASERLVSLLPAHCQAVALPNMFLRLYWPFWRSGEQPHQLCDMLLDDLLRRGVSESELAMLAMRPSLLRHYDIRELVEKSLRHERAKEALADIPHVELMLELCRQRRAFYSVNHPGEELLYYVADEVLQRLGLPLLDRGRLPALDDYYTALEMPIHPFVGQEFGLEFVQEDSRYRVYGAFLTYGEFVQLYGRYKASGVASFIDYMGRLGKELSAGRD